MITEETKKKNYSLYIKKLDQLGVNTEKLNEVWGKEIMNATFTNSTENGCAYDGSLLEIILKVLTPYAVKLNELLPEGIRVDKDTLVKVCLLHHISKAIKLIPNDNQWEVEKRGLLYKYNQELPSIRTGLMSLCMLNECGIMLTTDEIDALTINDRDLTDDQARWYSSIMASIVRQANELTYLQLKNQ